MATARRRPRRTRRCAHPSSPHSSSGACSGSRDPASSACPRNTSRPASPECSDSFPLPLGEGQGEGLLPSHFTMLRIPLAGDDAILHPSGAAFLPSHSTLLIADAHFGKAVSFRKLGVPVPSGTTSETLAAVDEALRDTGAQSIVIFGEFLHSRRSHAS